MLIKLLRAGDRFQGLAREGRELRHFVTVRNNPGRLAGSWGGQGQAYLEASASGRGDTHTDSAIVAHDNFLNEREAEPGSFLFGREEGAEHPLSGRRVNAGTVVMHRDPGGLRVSFDAAINHD